MKLKIYKGPDIDKVLASTNKFLGSLDRGQFQNTIINPNLLESKTVEKTWVEDDNNQTVTTTNKHHYEYVSITYYLTKEEVRPEPTAHTPYRPSYSS